MVALQFCRMVYRSDLSMVFFTKLGLKHENCMKNRW